MNSSESRSGIPFYFIQSSYDINLYNPRYLRVSWWTLKKFKTERITRQFSKMIFQTFLLECLLRRESYCPGIALSEHEGKLHFITLRAMARRVSKWSFASCSRRAIPGEWCLRFEFDLQVPATCHRKMVFGILLNIRFVSNYHGVHADTLMYLQMSRLPLFEDYKKLTPAVNRQPCFRRDTRRASFL